MSMSVQKRWEEFRFRIEQLPEKAQTALAVFGCQRAGRFYFKFCQDNGCRDSTIVAEVIELGWRALLGNFTRVNIELRGRLETAARELEGGDALSTAAQEACFPCMVLLEILGGETGAKQVIRIINFLRDIIDMLAQEDRSFNKDTNDLDREVLQSPLMIDELEHLHSALDLLNENREFSHAQISDLMALAKD